MRKRFENALKKRFIPIPRNIRLRYHLKRAARRGDFFFCGRTECLSVNSELNFEFTITENFNGILGAADEAMRTQKFRGHGFAGGEHVEFLEIDDGIIQFKRVVKTAFGDAAMQRHLAALKTTATRI